MFLGTVSTAKINFLKAGTSVLIIRFISQVLRTHQRCSVFVYIYIHTHTHIHIYLAALGLSWSLQDLCWVMWDLSLGHTDSLVVAYGLSSSSLLAPECVSFSGCSTWTQLLCGMGDLSSLTREQTWVHYIQGGFLATKFLSICLNKWINESLGMYQIIL